MEETPTVPIVPTNRRREVLEIWPTLAETCHLYKDKRLLPQVCVKHKAFKHGR